MSINKDDLNNVEDINNINNIDNEQSNALNEEIQNYLSDSDVDDPKYIPQKTDVQKSVNISEEQYGENFHDEILNLQRNMEMKNKNLLEKENELNLLKTEIIKLREKNATQKDIISQYESVIKLSKDKLTLLNQTNDQIKKQNEELTIKNETLENEIKSFEAYKQDVNKKDSPTIEMIKNQLDEQEKEYSKKESQLIKKYEEKESNLKKDFLDEISELNKQIGNLREENGKLKFENSNQSITIEKINSEKEEKEFDYNTEINKKNKEINKLKTLLEEDNKKLEELESNYQQQISFNEEKLKNLNEERENLMNELEEKDKKIFDLESLIDKLNSDINISKQEIKQKEDLLITKDLNNQKLINQIELLGNNIEEKTNELEINKQNNIKEFSDKNMVITNLVKEKNQLFEEKTALENNLNLATNKILELNDIIQDKLNYIQNDKYKETEKNENIKKKLLGIIKQLKFKEQSLSEENGRLKDIINKKENEKQQIEMSYQNELNNISLFNNFNNNSQYLNNTQNYYVHPQNMLQNNSMAQINNLNPYSSYRFDESKEEEQKRTLEEFKKLLTKIDEKLDSDKIE